MARLPDADRSRAILIGTSDYERQEMLQGLPAIRNNLTALEAILTNPRTGVFRSDSCIVVDTPDSPRSLMARLTRGAALAEDVLLVYYAGHGLLNPAGDLHLAVRETDQGQLDGTAVPYEWIRQTLLNSIAKLRILILDCCFSGRAVGAMSSDSAALAQIDISGTYILASTTANQISISPPGEKFTAFTGELIKLLSIESQHSLPLGEIYGLLSAGLARRGLPKPKCSVGDTIGDLILRKQVIHSAQYETTLTSGIQGRFEHGQHTFDAPSIYESYQYRQYSNSAAAPQRQFSRSASGQHLQNALHPLAAHDSKSNTRVLHTSLKYLIGIIAFFTGLLFSAVFAVGLDQAIRGDDNGGGGLVGTVFAIVFAFFVMIGCIEAVAKTVSSKRGLLISRGLRRCYAIAVQRKVTPRDGG